MVSVFGRPDPNIWNVARVEKNKSLACSWRRDFSAFLKSSNIPACSDQAIFLLILSGEEEGLRKRLDNESDEK